MIPWFLETIKKKIIEKIQEKIKKKLKIQSPSRVFSKIDSQIGSQMFYGFNVADMQYKIETVNWKNHKFQVTKPYIITKVDQYMSELRWFEYELDNRNDLV